MKTRIGPAVLSGVQGDIADQEVEAVVNAANNHLWMGSGVAGAIKQKGGIAIEQEAMAQGPVEIGSAVITSAGSLKAGHVIHAAVMGQDLQTSADVIRIATGNSLNLAEHHQLMSVAFPALAPVWFVLFDTAAREVFEHELKRRSTASP